MPTKQNIEQRFKQIQDSICKGLEQLDGKAFFHQDEWSREGGGGGRTRIIQEGNLIEKGGVNFSAVYGELPEVIQKALGVSEKEFYATGVSIVLHPNSPLAPIIHMNIRYFEMNENVWWFGGGIDLTPHYIVEENAKVFHQQLKAVCDKTHSDFYAKHKAWADDYFFIKHRNETRGIGGVFFDRLHTENTPLTKQQLFDYVCNLGENFVNIYTEQTNKRHEPFTPQHTEWQRLRRGRYVEFNLVYDKGTKFGLDTSGRIESILMSLPKDASWFYDYQALPKSEEAKTLSLLKKGVDWVK